MSLVSSPANSVSYVTICADGNFFLPSGLSGKSSLGSEVIVGPYG